MERSPSAKARRCTSMKSHTNGPLALTALKVHNAIWLSFMQICGFCGYSLHRLNRKTRFLARVAVILLHILTIAFWYLDGVTASSSMAGSVFNFPIQLSPYLRAFCAGKMLYMQQSFSDLSMSLFVTFAARTPTHRIFLYILLGSAMMLCMTAWFFIDISTMSTYDIYIADFADRHNGSFLGNNAKELWYTALFLSTVSSFGFESISCFVVLLTAIIAQAFGVLVEDLEKTSFKSVKIEAFLTDCRNLCALVTTFNRQFSSIQSLMFLQAVCMVLAQMQFLCENAANGKELSLATLAAALWMAVFISLQISTIIYALEQENRLHCTMKVMLIAAVFPEQAAREMRNCVQRFKNPAARVNLGGIALDRPTAVTIFSTLFGYILLSAQVNKKYRPAVELAVNDTVELARIVKNAYTSS